MAIARTGLNLASRAFIPTIYSKKMLAKFYAASVCDKICNQNWQGEILGQGNQVIIRQRPDVDVTPSTVNGKIQWQDLVDTSQTLSIDYAFDAAVKIDTIDMHQMDINIQPEVVDEIANRLRLKVENTVLGSVYSSASNTIAYNAFTSWNTSGSSIKTIAQAQRLLSVNNAPMEGRWLLLHPHMVQYLIQESALYALNAGTPQGALQAGFVGEMAGFKIFQSPLVPGAGTAASPYKALAGHTESITLATQFTQFEIVPQLQDFYGSGIRAQNCFGFKVVKPEILVEVNGYIS